MFRFDLCSVSSAAPLRRHRCRNLGLGLHCSTNLHLRVARHTQHWTREAASYANRANLHLCHWRNGARPLVLFLLFLLVVAILPVLVVAVGVLVVGLRS